MVRRYDIKMVVEQADGMVAARYRGVKARGTISIEGTEEQFSDPAGKTFTVSGQVTGAQYPTGEELGARQIQGMKFGPIQHTYGQDTQVVSGSNWSVSLIVKLDGDRLTATVLGVGTGFTRFAARNIEITITGALNTVR